MLIDAIRLLLFPALMAFAASSDLLTMTISNRLSLALVGGFLPAHHRNRHGLCRDRHASRRRRVGAGRCLRLFSQGWIGGGDAKLGGRHSTLVRLRLPARLSGLCVAARRRADAGADPIPPAAAAGRCSPASNGSCACMTRPARALRHRAGGGGAHRLSEDRMDARLKPARNTLLTRFRYRSLTMP